MRQLLFAFLLSLIAMDTSYAQGAAHTPVAGSSERSEILEAARLPLQQKLGQPVQFVVETLKVDGDWGFLFARMQGESGGDIDYSRTSLAGAAEQGYVSQQFAGLMHRQNDGWVVWAEATGPTDMAWANWAQEFGAPQTIFELDD